MTCKISGHFNFPCAVTDYSLIDITHQTVYHHCSRIMMLHAPAWQVLGVFLEALSALRMTVF